MLTFRIPVLLQLDLPSSWDQAKVLEVIDEMRLKSSDMTDTTIRIKAVSTDDLYVSADFADSFLNVNKLRSEFDSFLSTIIQKAGIVKTQPAEMGVNLEILDRTGIFFGSLFIPQL